MFGETEIMEVAVVIVFRYTTLAFYVAFKFQF
jgi:hypothetical protein